MLIVAVGIHPCTRKQYLIITTISSNEEHILERHVWVYRTIAVIFLVQPVSVGCSQVNQFLACLGRLFPFCRVIGRVKDKLSFIIAIVRIVAVAIDERTCCKQQ